MRVMEVLRNILAAVFGIIILIFVILLARWTGEKIRERFFTPKQIVTVQETTPPSLMDQKIDQKTDQKSAATPVSTIPSTGPAEVIYLLSGLTAAGGILLRRISS